MKSAATSRCIERDDEAAIISKRLPPISVPITPDAWRVHFKDYFQDKRDAQEAYDRARICTLEFSAVELGAFTIRCERDFTPLRWVVRRHGEGHVVRLYDDSGHSQQSLVSHVAFETPCVEETLASGSEYQVPASGGLYVARTEGLIAAIIVPPVLQGHGFAELGLIPNVERWERSLDSVIRAVGIAGLWGRARLRGGLLSAIRQRSVMLALISELCRLLCGDNWARTEKEVTSNGSTGAVQALSRAVSRHPKEASVGAVLFRDAETIARDACNDRVHQLASLAVEHRLLPDGPSSWDDEDRAEIRKR